MNKVDFDLFDNVLGCYFNQDFDLICGNINNAMNEINSEHDSDELLTLINQINEILRIAKNEENLADILCKIFQIQVTTKVGGDNMNTYTELLVYIRDNIKNQLKSKWN